MPPSEIMKCEHEIREHQGEQAAPPMSLAQAKETLRTERWGREVTSIEGEGKGSGMAWRGLKL